MTEGEACLGQWRLSNGLHGNAPEGTGLLACTSKRWVRQVRGAVWQVSNLPARELVPGDVVFLRVGDRVPADCRVASLNTATLRAEQASLTGTWHTLVHCWWSTVAT